MFRLILVGIIVSLYFILSIITLPLAWLIGLVINKRAKQYFSYFLVSKTFFLVRLAAGTKVDIRGLENIPKGQPVLFAGNHRSYFDIILNYSILPPRPVDGKYELPVPGSFQSKRRIEDDS